MKKSVEREKEYAIKFDKDRTAENFELKRKYRNIAGNQGTQESDQGVLPHQIKGI